MWLDEEAADDPIMRRDEGKGLKECSYEKRTLRLLMVRPDEEAFYRVSPRWTSVDPFGQHRSLRVTTRKDSDNRDEIALRNCHGPEQRRLPCSAKESLDRGEDRREGNERSGGRSGSQEAAFSDQAKTP